MTPVPLGVDRLPVCRAILDVIHSAEMLQQRSAVLASTTNIYTNKRNQSGAIPCSACEQEKAIWFCQACCGSALFCESCWALLPVHKATGTAHRKHSITADDETTSAVALVRMCALHPNLEQNVFCKTDQTIACVQCHLETHKGHDAVELRTHLLSMLETLQVKLNESQLRQNDIWCEYVKMQDRAKKASKQNSTAQAAGGVQVTSLISAVAEQCPASAVMSDAMIQSPLRRSKRLTTAPAINPSLCNLPVPTVSQSSHTDQAASKQEVVFMELQSSTGADHQTTSAEYGVSQATSHPAHRDVSEVSAFVLLLLGWCIGE